MQVIIVLGGGINADGSPPTHVKTRLDLAKKEYYKVASRIILSGRGAAFKIKKDEHKYHTEATSMKKYLVDAGVPEKDLLIEDKSLDTVGNLLFCRKRYLDRYNWFNLIVITSTFHQQRSKIICDWVLGKKFTYSVLGSSDARIAKQPLEQRILVEKKLIAYFKQNVVNHAQPGNVKEISLYLFKKDPTYTGISNPAHNRILKIIKQARALY